MYKVLIADDEGIVIDALKFIIQKNFGNSCSVTSVKTGRAAIEHAEQFRPDIIFMDIHMPGINGIEAMKSIREHNRDAVLIVVTAFDKFDYAREAICLGVLEYVNKPIQQTQIVALLKRAMAQIDAEKEKRSHALEIREKLETVVPIIESGLIYSILFQENYMEDIEQFRALLGFEGDYGFVLVVKFGEDQMGDDVTNAVTLNVRAQKYFIQLKETIKEFFPGVVGPPMANTLIAYIPREKPDKGQEYAVRIEKIENARRMVKKLREIMDVTFRVGIGSIKHLKKAGESYWEAVNAMEYAEGSVAHAKDLPLSCRYEADYPIEVENALFAAIENGDVNGARIEAERFFDWMMERHGDEMWDIKLKCLEFILLAEKISYESGGRTYCFQSRHDYLPSIVSIQHYDELKAWFLNKIKEVCRNISTKKEKSMTGITEKAKDFIDENFHKDLSLNDVSQRVNISPYYFSKLFKEETGENFIEYLTRIRMEKAKTLLGQTDLSVKEICNQVGYTDPNYFSRTFKKNIGVTPTEFKEGQV